MNRKLRHRDRALVSLLLGGLLGFALGPSTAQAQRRSASDAPSQPPTSLNEYVLGWARGDFVSPIVCRLGDDVTRALRRVNIEPGPSDVRPPVAIIHFVDLEADEATRCFTEIGLEAPNLIGSLDVRHRVTRSRATAMRDFKAELRRKKGFDLEIVAGELEIGEVKEGPDEVERVRFRGGQAHLAIVRTGSDAARLLADFPTQRKLELTLESPDGRILKLPLAWIEPSPSRR